MSDPMKITLIGGAELEAALSRIGSRARDLRPEFVEAARLLEETEAAIFAAHGGKYVETGATKASLTQPEANGAIREVHETGLAFGTSVWYARFPGTTGKGRHAAPSAILNLEPETVDRVAERMIAYVTGSTE